MAAADELIVREYFESCGFLVRQMSKYQVQSRKKRAEEEIDFAVCNPRAEGSARATFVLDAASLKSVKYAIVSVKPWHTSLFSPALLGSAKDVFGFLKRQALKRAEEFFPEADEGEIRKIMAVPGLASAQKLRRETVEILKKNGVDGVLTYPTMLQGLVDKIEPNNNYAKSDLLQTLRILKNYGMIKSAQMELFS